VFYYADGTTSTSLDKAITSSSHNAAKTLTSVVIGTVANTIADNAFNNSNSLSAVSIGSSVSAIPPGAFSTNSLIASFTVNASNLYYSSLDGVLFNKLQTQLLIYPNAKLATSYTVPNGVTDVNTFYTPDGSSYSTYPGFARAKYLTDVTISNSVTSIYDGAFINCHKLSNINLGNSLKKFGYASFQACTGLNTVTIPSSVTNIGSYTFINCSSLQSVYFLGNAPTGGFQPFLNTTCTVYYCTDKTGFSNPYQDRPAVAITCAQASTDQLFGAGNNTFGQLGLGNYEQKNSFTYLDNKWSQVTCGSDFTMALSASNNALFGTGDNSFGQIGLGYANYSPPYGPTTFTQAAGNWSKMSCGGWHTMALSAGTTKWFGTGRNDYGQLGLGYSNYNINVLTQVAGDWSQMVCGGYHTMALSAGTTKWFSTGFNDYGALGLGNTVSRNVFTPLTGNWSQMSCGAWHTMALSADNNALFSTGGNFGGELGLGNDGASTYRTTFTRVTGDWSQVVCGGKGNTGGHTMALSAGTTKWFGTGGNSSGTLGLGNTVSRNVFTPLTGNWSQMSCGAIHTMALSAGTNALFCTGDNSTGALGLGDTVRRTSFTRVAGDWSQMAGGRFYTMALSALQLQ
jgi:alpha-tubulin suppressor-like RCC1 family protein